MRNFFELLVALYRLSRDAAVVIALLLAIAGKEDAEQTRIFRAETIRRVNALWHRMNNPPPLRRPVRPIEQLAGDLRS